MGPPNQHQIMQRNHHPIALPPITYQQQLAQPRPQQHLAIDYDPRGVKRQSTDVRIGDRKKVLLEDERTDSIKRKRENIRRNIERKIRKLDDEVIEYMQKGSGVLSLLNKLKSSTHDSNGFVDLLLSNNEVKKICECIECYLDGEFEFDDEYGEHFDREMQEDFRINMEELIDDGRSLQSKRNFLLNSHRGVRITCFVREHLLQKVCDYFTLQCHRKRKCCEVLKKRLNKINNKIENSEDYEEKGSGESSDEEGESGGSSDEKEDEGGEEEESEGEEASEISESEEGEEGDSDGIDESDDREEEGDGDEEDEDDREEEGDGDEEDEDDGDSQYKNKIVLDCGRDRPLTWEY